MKTRNKYARHSWLLLILLSSSPSAHCTNPENAMYPEAGFIFDLSQPVTVGSGDHCFITVPGWGNIKKSPKIGATHGNIVIDKSGKIYASTSRSVLVYSPEGKVVSRLKIRGLHSMVINEENGEEFIYGVENRGAKAVKFDLKGKIQWTINGKEQFPDAKFTKPTAIAVTPDGMVIIADGYGTQKILFFSPGRQFIRSVGSAGTNHGEFKKCHGLFIDTRGRSPALLVADRENHRIQVFDLRGSYISTPITGLKRPCSFSMWNDFLAVAELEGRVVILDKQFNIISELGKNDDKTQRANYKVDTMEWRTGIFTAPHGCAFDKEGNLFVMDWNFRGRITKLRRLK